ncbi:hypothetical protein A2W14_05275 [Candidatus Gottesmanbacteria bacterium RBG_16_37_8]|uniref:Uncharacterized protein n=1 Tax=Candidatus Gottesmanbacteria bacterium RBG_16_37_8 TaxID=1798371 RepID=A0A1F5YSL3_9BACT|nr:MAG: hypothetical protein A2W14_05275 [Candidatus Gottesmanbacteria bacterium RBG_16_37_8]
MNKAIKTTIMLPEDELLRAKMAALQENITLSEIIRDALVQRTPRKTETRKKKKDPMRLAGVFKLGVKKGDTFRRKDMYDQYLKRKMGI